MAIQSFTEGKQFLWQGQLYQVKRLLPGSFLTIENLTTTAIQTVFFLDLVKAIYDNELQFTDNGRPVQPPDTYQDLSDCPTPLRELATYRLAVIQPLLTRRTGALVAARVREYQEAMARGERPVMAISQGSVYRWIRAYVSSGHDIRALINEAHKQGGLGQGRLQTELETLVSTVIQERFYVRTRVSVDDLYQEVCLRVTEENRQRSSQDQLPKPSRATVGRRVASLDPQGKVAAKRGEQEARRHFSQVGAMASPQRPLERVEIDHTVSDIIIVDENDLLPLGRLTLTFSIDSLTRYPLGFYMGFEPPSYLAVMECLYHSILPKGDVLQQYGSQHPWLACGLPTTLVIDNGKEFVGRDLEDACLTLGITLERNPVRCPHLKPAIERGFGTLNTGLFHTLPGTTFANLGQRGDYDSLKQACLTLAELDKIFVKFLVDVYAESWHRGLEGIPARAWQAFVDAGFFPRVPAQADNLLITLGRVTERTVRRDGIEFESLRYNCDRLVSLRTRFPGQKLKVKYHPADLSRLHVYDPDDHCYLEVPALDQPYTKGLSLWKHRVVRRFLRQRGDQTNPEALAQAKRDIQEMVAQSQERQKRSARQKSGRWQTSGKTRSLQGQGAEKGNSSRPVASTETKGAGGAVTGETTGPGPATQPAFDLDSLPDLTQVDSRPAIAPVQLPGLSFEWDRLENEKVGKSR